MARCTLRVGMACGFLCLVLACQFVVAQSTTGSIYGQVTDLSGAVVVGADVTAVNQATGVNYKAQSDSAGNYTVFDLPPGSYRVAVTMTGFETTKIDDVHITIDQKQLVSFQMKVGASTEIVTVTAPPTLLQTESAETGDDMTAIGVMRKSYEEGLVIPRDLSLIGFDDIRLARFVLPPLTSVQMSQSEIARLAFYALLSDVQRDTPAPNGTEYGLRTSLVLRESTGMVPASAVPARRTVRHRGQSVGPNKKWARHKLIWYKCSTHSKRLPNWLSKP